MNGVISKIERASALVELTRPIWEQGLEVPEVDLKAALSSLNMGESSSHAELGKKILARSKEGRYLRPRTIRQKEYVESIENFDLTFAIGPAGTGKTFLATVCAARLLNEKKIEKIVLTSTNSECRTGDVVQYSAIAYDKKGQKINESFPFKYSFTGKSFDKSNTASGLIFDDGRFVGDVSGKYVISASLGNISSSKAWWKAGL